MDLEITVITSILINAVKQMPFWSQREMPSKSASQSMEIFIKRLIPPKKWMFINFTVAVTWPNYTRFNMSFQCYIFNIHNAVQMTCTYWIAGDSNFFYYIRLYFTVFLYWPEAINVTFHFLTYWLAKSNFCAIKNHIALSCKTNEWNYVARVCNMVFYCTEIAFC